MRLSRVQTTIWTKNKTTYSGSVQPRPERLCFVSSCPLWDFKICLEGKMCRKTWDDVSIGSTWSKKPGAACCRIGLCLQCMWRGGLRNAQHQHDDTWSTLLHAASTKVKKTATCLSVFRPPSIGFWVAFSVLNCIVFFRYSWVPIPEGGWKVWTGLIEESV